MTSSSNQKRQKIPIIERQKTRFLRQVRHADSYISILKKIMSADE